MTGAARPGVGVAGDLGWFASVGCTGFPPSRERRVRRGNDGWGLLAISGGLRVLVALGSRTPWRIRDLRENDRRSATGGGGVGDLGGCACWLHWVPAFAGMTGGGGKRREGRGNDGCGATGGGGGWRSRVVCECWLHWVPAFAGMTGGGGKRREGRGNDGRGAGTTGRRM